MTRLKSPTLFISLLAGIPNILSAAPTDTPHIVLTSLDLADECRCANAFGYMPDGKLVALTMVDDETVKELGVATFDSDDNLVFALADLIEDSGKIVIQTKRSGGVMLKADGTVITFDPRVVAKKLVELGHGAKVLSGDLALLSEGDTLTFGARAALGGGTKIDDLTLVQIAGKTFGGVNIGDIVLVTALVQSGQTYVSGGVIGHIEGSMMADVTPSDLAAFGIGVATAVPPRLATTGHGATRATVAA